MKVIIAGGRDTEVSVRNLTWLDAFVPEDVTEVVSGGARGADKLGEIWADKQGVPVKFFYADWDKHGRAAGPVRNRQMAEYADCLVVFPGGRGTANMIDEASKRGLKIINQKDQP